MKNYRVQFVRITKENNEKGKPVKTGEEEYIGEVQMDDTGTGKDLTLAAKAFRRAAESHLMADKVIITEL